MHLLQNPNVLCGEPERVVLSFEAPKAESRAPDFPLKVLAPFFSRGCEGVALSKPLAASKEYRRGP